MIRASGALVSALMVATCSAAVAQDYNPRPVPQAPADGSVIVNPSPNGVGWLNDMLGLSPAFFTSAGAISGAYLTPSDSGVVKGTAGSNTPVYTLSWSSGLGALQAVDSLGSYHFPAVREFGGAVDTAVSAYTGLSTSNKGGVKFCSDCYSTANTNKTAGIPVWWSGSAWQDALGYPVGHP